ncbi:L-rhamnose mutarotase [Neobacillus vireti]|uniref:L-rhamnose mutarotase n=1 Tax=Neobacillus vireti TaxID=220686 RepID=UPI002FFDBF24
MIKKATVMKVFEGFQEEYKKRHDEIWPELAQELKNHGAHHYSIFLDEKTNNLFAYVEIESEVKWNAMAHTDVCQKWWAFMKDIMETNPDNSPVAIELKQVFYLD